MRRVATETLARIARSGDASTSRAIANASASASVAIERWSADLMEVRARDDGGWRRRATDEGANANANANDRA